MPAPRRATQAQRRFSPEALAALARDDRRKLVQVLLTESGNRVVEVHRPAAYDELILETRPLWRPRRVRVRVAARPSTQDDVDRLAEAVEAAGEAEGVLLAALGSVGELRPPTTIMVIDADQLIARLERCTSIAWPGRQPVPAYERVAVQRDLERDAFLLDPAGLRWLPTLALNELPAELTGRNLVPDALLERMAFRLMTGVLRFGGTRHGEAARGQRLPDAVLAWSTAPRLLALMDCKATADGYLMDSDHYLRFTGYVSTMREQLEADGAQLRYLVVLSSSFSGTPGGRHPFHARAGALRDDTGLQLVYLRAEDLARAAVSVESRELSPAAREALDWSTVFDYGIVTADHLDSMLED
jgi:hypothetical protein